MGDGPGFVFIPSLGRPPSDFDELSSQLAEHYTTVSIYPRGVGKSEGPFLPNISLHDFAKDIAGAMKALKLGPSVILGHDFGSRVARVVAADFPQLVESLVLANCGGEVKPSNSTLAKLSDVFNLTRPSAERLQDIKDVFFYGDHDPVAVGWGPDSGTWYGALAFWQGIAGQNTNTSSWIDGGNASMLIIQGLGDVTAPPENSVLLKKRLGSRVTLVNITEAGHALIPEQPKLIYKAIMHNLKSSATSSAIVV